MPPSLRNQINHRGSILIKNAIFTIADAAGIISLLHKFPIGSSNRHRSLCILNYHRVDLAEHRPFLGDNVISTSPDQFRKQMELISENYHPITAEELINAVRENSDLPINSVLITVDDGYLDFKEVIHPITHRLGIKPVLFVATNFVGENIFWWDKLYHILFCERRKVISGDFGRYSLDSLGQKYIALNQISDYLKRNPFFQTFEWIDQNFHPDSSFPVYTLNWSELKELASQGVTIAAHSHNHPIMTQISIDEARNEIKRSRDLITANIGKFVPIFAYPDGQDYATNLNLARMVKEEGFSVALTTKEGLANLNSDDPFLLPRLGVWPDLNPGRFHFHLTPAYDSRIRNRPGKE